MAASAFAALSLGGEPLDGEDPASPPLLDLVEKFPDLLDTEVLWRVDPADRAFFAQVSHGCREVVMASELPCAGTRVGMRQLNPSDRARLAGAVRALFYSDHSPLAASLGYVASSDLSRAGGVVRLELREFCTSAARLAWAKASGSRWDEWTCTLAAQGGHLEALRWAREHDCPWGSTTCARAAECGHLAVLQWARAHGCEWDTWTCQYAAQGGHLEVLQWARAHGCTWQEHRMCFDTAARGQLESVEVVAGDGLPVGREDVPLRRSGRAPGGAEVDAGARLRVERGPRP